MGKLLPEWLDANYNKAYPLAEATAAVPDTIPSRVLLDAMFLVGGPMDWERLYISKVVCDEYTVRMFLSCEFSGDIVELGEFVSISMSSPPYTEIPFELKVPALGVLLTGYVTVGDVSRPPFLATVTELTYEQGKLYEGVVIPITEWTAGLVVDGELHYGAINMVAGPGIRFESKALHKNGVTVPVVYVTCTDSIVTTGDDAINTDTDMLNYIYNSYGAPVYSILGVYPDEDGNIDLTLGDGSTPPSVSLEPGGIGRIRVNDNRTKPCCNDDDLQFVVDNVENMNLRFGRLDAAVSALNTSINTMSGQLALLQRG